MNTVIFLGILIVVAIIVLFQWSTYRMAKKSEGMDAPNTEVIDDGNLSNKKVYFFHSEKCGPCRAIKPMVEKLRQENKNLIMVDIMQYTDIARGFGVAATPSFVAVVNGVINEVKVGAVTEPWLLDNL